MFVTSPNSFEQFFGVATPGQAPFAYQRRLAHGEEVNGACVSRLIDVPTGCGKTAAVVLAWLWNRVSHPDEKHRATWPRRLVYCLSMRTLVEQTRDDVIVWVKNLKRAEQVKVSILMGGEDADDWELRPEQDAILIGTQDLLLSRALNRGYGIKRFRWPMHFGLLNNDCLWVIDETQLMGSGLATTVQLDAFRQKLWPPQFACPCWWMSATVGEGIFDTRDRADFQVAAPERFFLSQEERAEPAIDRRLNADKTIQALKARPKSTSRDGSGILDRHAQTPGRISLVIMNTVAAAREIFQEIKADLPKRFRNQTAPLCLLLHSRFRPEERKKTMAVLDRFIASRDKATGAVPDHSGLILVSTQVVEAGLDISAATLWSEIALWSSVIQRLGRLNREGLQPDATAYFWMPKAEEAENKKGAPNAGRVGPYEKAALQVAGKLVEELAVKRTSGLAYRGALDAVLKSDASKKVMRAEPEAVIRPDDLFGLFSTEPDLAGGFTDISLFVRDQDRNADAQVYWRDLAKGKEPLPDEPDPLRDELCAVPFHELRLFLDRTKSPAWEWDSETGRWLRRRAPEIFPGMTLLLAHALGGYSAEAGWTGHASDEPPLIELRPTERESLGTDLDSESDWLPLADHTADVQAQLDRILKKLGGIAETPEGRALTVAARWHDIGKTHRRWQEAVTRYVAAALEKLELLAVDPATNPKFAAILPRLRDVLQREQPGRTLWGKFPDLRPAWNDRSLTEAEAAELKEKLSTPFQPDLRHDAASALVAWKLWLGGNPKLTALACYLVATHHGKIRTVLRASGRARNVVFGLREGEELPALPGYFETPQPLDYSPRLLGSAGEWDEQAGTFTPAAPSWVAIVGELLGPALPGDTQPAAAVPVVEPRSLGPFRLAYLEALLTAADICASRAPGEVPPP